MDHHLVHISGYGEAEGAYGLGGADLQAGITLGIPRTAVELDGGGEGQRVIALGVGLGRGDVGAVVVGGAAVLAQVKGGQLTDGNLGGLSFGLGGSFGLGVGGGGGDLTVHGGEGRGDHTLGNLAAEHEPCQLGVINEGIAVALNTLNHLVAAHFPRVYGVKLAPSQQYIHAFEDLGHVGCAPIRVPADVHVQDDAGHVALDVVGGLVVACGSGLAVGLVAAGGVHALLGGTDVVEVSAAAGGVAAAKALGPDMLAVAVPRGRPVGGGHAVIGVEGGGVGGVIVLAVHVEDQITAIVVGGDGFVGGCHQGAEGGLQTARRQLYEAFKGVVARVVVGGARAVQRNAHLVSLSRIGLRGVNGGLSRRGQDQQDRHQHQHSQSKGCQLQISLFHVRSLHIWFVFGW